MVRSDILPGLPFFSFSFAVYVASTEVDFLSTKRRHAGYALKEEEVPGSARVVASERS